VSTSRPQAQQRKEYVAVRNLLGIFVARLEGKNDRIGEDETTFVLSLVPALKKKWNGT
jgi:hypothetical protein